jgi:hypothetical protein
MAVIITPLSLQASIHVETPSFKAKDSKLGIVSSVKSFEEKREFSVLELLTV